jgi:hypothetical protein
MRLVKGDGNACGRSVAILAEIDKYFLLGKAKSFPKIFENSGIGLMRNHKIDISNPQTVFPEQGVSPHPPSSDCMLKNFTAVHADVRANPIIGTQIGVMTLGTVHAKQLP